VSRNPLKVTLGVSEIAETARDANRSRLRKVVFMFSDTENDGGT
jgi:hypothetical protein